MFSVLGSPVQADAALPDPTRPPDYFRAATVPRDAPAQKADFRVNAIRISSSDRSAIINGLLVREGDAVGTAVVKEINIQAVTLDHNRKLLTVPIYTKGFSKKFKNSDTGE